MSDIQFFANQGQTASDKVAFTGYQHARKLYLDNNYHKFKKYANTPKAAFLYFVKFNVNQRTALTVNGWDPRHTALLTKSITLPKFKIGTETLNQYNRKTNVQTKLNYEPVQLELHDDMNDATNYFWVNYYKYFYQDSRYGDSNNVKTAYADNKYGNTDYKYGFDSAVVGGTNSTKGESYFLDSIDIFVLHGGHYTQFTLVNPMISAWEHDTVAQSEGNKVLQNKMTVVYENVIYSVGDIARSTDKSSATLFEDGSVYDTEPSPTPNTVTLPYSNIPEAPEFSKDCKAPVRQTVPTYQQRQKSISLGSVISSINKARQFIQNPRQTWNVYGINIKNEVRNTIAGKIDGIQINLTSNSGTPQQGEAKKETSLKKLNEDTK
jgi:hypothetical protein